MLPLVVAMARSSRVQLKIRTYLVCATALSSLKQTRQLYYCTRDKSVVFCQLRAPQCKAVPGR
eukprot:40795-Pleurochrysis_carterae.AAC.5